jgi:AcrR family transcriptional regulator
MKNIPARLIRAVVEDIPGLRPELNPRMEKTRDQSLQAATRTFAILGRRGVTMRALANASWISRDRIYFHYLDVDCILEAVLFKHLQAIIRTMSNAESTPQARRAAYFRYTRGPGGGPTREHGIFIFETRHLPDDLRPNIVDLHAGLGSLLCPEQPGRVLDLLDHPGLDLPEVEHLLANAAAQPEADAPAAEPVAPAAAAKAPPVTHAQPTGPLPTTAGPAATATPKPPNIHPLAAARPLLSRPTRPPRTMASLVKPIEDPPAASPMPHRAVAAPSTA